MILKIRRFTLRMANRCIIEKLIIQAGSTHGTQICLIKFRDFSAIYCIRNFVYHLIIISFKLLSNTLFFSEHMDYLKKKYPACVNDEVKLEIFLISEFPKWFKEKVWFDLVSIL